jgi:FtsP/CotA-like multicopper oxidase with cupredoxin domain
VQSATPHRFGRRHFLVLSGGAVALAACSGSDDHGAPSPRRTAPIDSSDPVVAAQEALRSKSDATVVRASLTAAPTTVDLAGREVTTWSYGPQLGGDPLRARAGDIVEVALRNDLPEDTTVHWHGLAIRNDMDGVHDLTQAAIRPGDTFTYRFALAHPGTYFFHPHVGVQLDRGLYAPLIIDDPADPGDYDAEHILILDDWLDGFGLSPTDVAAQLTNGNAMAGMDHGAAPADQPAPGAAMGRFTSPALGGDAGDVAYALHLINGRPPGDRPTFEAPAGGPVRLRIINAGSDTAYRFAVGGHRLTVTHTDGFPIEPIEVDAVIIGMGERYDVTVRPSSGTWPIVAAAEGKGASAVAVLRTTDSPVSAAPPVDATPDQLTGQMLDYRSLRATAAARMDSKPERTIDVELTGDMKTYQWGMRAAGREQGAPIEVRQGERIRLNLRNTTTMWHPIHLHGHTFTLANAAGGARKDTVNVLPGETVPIDVTADNPGQWMLHCHNTYHLEGGMAATVAYIH